MPLGQATLGAEVRNRVLTEPNPNPQPRLGGHHRSRSSRATSRQITMYTTAVTTVITQKPLLTAHLPTSVANHAAGAVK
jgi:hypothetical protein